MAKKVQPEVKEKVQTKYDRKVEARKQKEAKDKKDEKIFKIVSSCLGIAVAAAIIIAISISVYGKYAAVNNTYIKIGNHEITKAEYDYYYNATVNNYLTAYSSILPYMGLDTTKEFDEQPYTEELTWKDMFDQMTADQMTQTYALADDAGANGFTYDDTNDYSDFTAGIAAAASTAGVTEASYYKSLYGDYATKSNVESYVRKGFLVTAYYNDLLEKNQPSEEEISSYYEANQQSYDKVDYRSFAVTAETEEEATEEEISKAMEAAKEKAEAFMAKREEGSEFEELCIEYASDENKANYEDAETEYSLTEGSYYSGVPSAVASWLYEEEREEGNITVIEDTASNRYFVVEFINKYYDEADDANIASTIAAERVTEYTAGLISNYEVTDVKGDLKYLTVDSSASEEQETTDEAGDTALEDTNETDQDTAAEDDSAAEAE